jgi:hypothetical protein
MRVRSVNGLRLNSCLIDANFVYCGPRSTLARYGVDIEMSSFDNLASDSRGTSILALPTACDSSVPVARLIQVA